MPRSESSHPAQLCCRFRGAVLWEGFTVALLQTPQQHWVTTSLDNLVCFQNFTSSSLIQHLNAFPHSFFFSLTYCPTGRQSVRLYKIQFAHSFPLWFSAGIQRWIQTDFAEIPSIKNCSSVPWKREFPSCSRTAHQGLCPAGHWVLPVLSLPICQLWDPSNVRALAHPGWHSVTIGPYKTDPHQPDFHLMSWVPIQVMA